MNPNKFSSPQNPQESTNRSNNNLIQAHDPMQAHKTMQKSKFANLRYNKPVRNFNTEEVNEKKISFEKRSNSSKSIKNKNKVTIKAI